MLCATCIQGLSFNLQSSKTRNSDDETDDKNDVAACGFCKNCRFPDPLSKCNLESGGSTPIITHVPFQGRGGRLVHEEPERIRMYHLKESKEENQLQVLLILQF
jgi:hypothetical protein